MLSIVLFYAYAFLWLGMVGVAAIYFVEARSPSLHTSLIYRLVGWLFVFLAIFRRLGFSTWEVSYRTLGGDSQLEQMHEWAFWAIISVGTFCLFVSWLTQYNKWAKNVDTE